MTDRITASIDIGSNSCLLLVAKVSKDSVLEILFRDQFVTQLGKDLDKTGVFCKESMDDTFGALNTYAKKIMNYGLKPEDVIVTATEAARVAKNSEEFFSKVKGNLSLNIQIITGEAEAYYSALGATIDQKDNFKELMIMDIGGASTELISLTTNPYRVNDFVSLPVGSVRMTNWFEEGILDSKIEALLEEYSDQINKFKSDLLLCVAGTMTSVASMELGNTEFIESEVHNHEFSTARLADFVEKYKYYAADDFLDDFPFLRKRAKAISGGIKVAKLLTRVLGVKKVIVSTYGLMFGVALEGGLKDEFIFR
ncbi:MAG: exopolyphosphatase/guanosine-5'-triphosphate,3'-diphosphate pyrophosphatase [Thermoproteota archaeon]|jgi:exopolyphosphatase/guanosine-5'-triphosphate,3'-diphosphate pyrophosphatase